MKDVTTDQSGLFEFNLLAVTSMHKIVCILGGKLLIISKCVKTKDECYAPELCACIHPNLPELQLLSWARGCMG